MTQYISTENQTILWKTIQRCPQFQNVTTINKEMWFSNIIGIFYEKYKHETFNTQTLKQLNQQTITYMIEDLKRITVLHTPSIASPTSTSVYTDNNRSNFPENALKREQTHNFNDQFSKRQQEYENMVKPPAPPIANFTEKLEDEKIKNMEELIRQQLKQREYDIAQLQGPPQIVNNSNVLENRDIVDSRMEISRSNTTRKVLSSIQTQNQSKTSLRDDGEIEGIKEVKREINQIKTELDEWKRNIMKQIDEMKSHIYNSKIVNTNAAENVSLINNTTITTNAMSILAEI